VQTTLDVQTFGFLSIAATCQKRFEIADMAFPKSYVDFAFGFESRLIPFTGKE
jgi:hypothetical protein